MIVLFALLSVLIVFFYGCQYSNFVPVKSVLFQRTDSLEDFNSNLISLKRQFSRQNTRFWQIIAASIKKVIFSDDLPYPAVLLLAHRKNGLNTVKCLASRIADGILSSYGFDGVLNINISGLFTNLTEEAAEIHLWDNLHEYVSQGGRLVFFQAIESLPANSISLMHGICDNSNAPFKNIIIVATLEVGSEEIEMTDDEMVEKTLYSLWSNIPVEIIASLLSRIANNVALVTTETSLCVS